MTAWQRAYSCAASSIAERSRPDSRSMSAQFQLRAACANASKPCVCCSMNPASSTRSLPSRRAASSISISDLHRPISTAESPPGLSWWYCVLMRVSAPPSICFGDCGSAKLTSPGSRSGLKVTMGTPRSRAALSWWSMRGLFTPTFWPKKKMQSLRSKSSRFTVPTPTPIVFGSATEVLSWHMFELSGRLLQPYRRARGWYMYEASSEERPEVLQLGADTGEGFLPAHLEVLVLRRIPAHRRGQPAAFLEIVVVPGPQLCERVLAKEFRRQLLVGNLPGGRFRAFLAELRRVRIGWLRPGAAHAGVAARFVLF